MEKQQIERKVAAADLQRVFGPDETKVAAQLDQKILQTVQQSAMEICLAVPSRQPEKLNHIGVLEDADC